ncbi:MAG: acetylornithine transaminase [Hyphomicrobiaceae bacterium]
MTEHVPNAENLMNITSRPPIIFERGEGSYLWDTSGEQYLDFIQGWAVNSLGHSPQLLSNAITRQAQKLITPSPAFFNAPSLHLAKQLSDLSCFDQVFFANSGAEAVEGAIKLARRFGELHRNGAYEIVTFDGAFHGRTLATMSASGKREFETLFAPKVPGFPKAVLNNIASVEQAITGKTVAVMLEPIQGEAGVRPATDEFLQQLQMLCSAEGLLLMVDEIQTGIGRTGKMFAFEHAEISPDIMVLGKGIGGGVPLAALLAKDAVSCFKHGDQGGTFNGNPLICAVGSAVVECVADAGFLQTVSKSGEYLCDGLSVLSRKFDLGNVRGRGLLVALDVAGYDANNIVSIAMQHGLLINAPRPDTLRFMPALNVSLREVDECIALLDKVLCKTNTLRAA